MKRDVGVSEAVSFIFVLLMILLLAAGVVLYGVPYIEEKKIHCRVRLCIRAVFFSCIRNG